MSNEFEFDTELTDLRESIGELCEQYAPESAVRAAMVSQTGYDRAFWKRLGSELGVLGLDVAEDFGGAEAGLVTQAVAVEALGSALVCGPVFGTVMLAIPLLNTLPASDERERLLSGLVEGDLTAAVAIGSFSATFDPSSVTVTASAGGTLSGTVAQVVDGSAADVLLVAARDGDGVRLYVVEGDASGLGRRALSTMDLTRRQAEITFDNTPATPLGDAGESAAAIEKGLLVAAVLLAAEQVGGAQHLLDLTVAYAKERFQFGRAIGTFQAVKHRLADLLVAVEQARSAMFHAAWALQDGTDDPRLAVSLAKAFCSETYQLVTAGATQLHGGIGVTWEHPVHLYHKRAATDALLLGRVDDHYEIVGSRSVDVA